VSGSGLRGGGTSPGGEEARARACRGEGAQATREMDESPSTSLGGLGRARARDARKRERERACRVSRQPLVIPPGSSSPRALGAAMRSCSSPSGCSALTGGLDSVMTATPSRPTSIVAVGAIVAQKVGWGAAASGGGWVCVRAMCVCMLRVWCALLSFGESGVGPRVSALSACVSVCRLRANTAGEMNEERERRGRCGRRLFRADEDEEQPQEAPRRAAPRGGKSRDSRVHR
jgi:hypothetical protein